MNAKEKALELSIKMCSKSDVFKPNTASKRKAIMLVDEIIKENKLFPYNTIFYERIEFWKQVKIEIKNLILS